jgi:hypothetical protein
VSRQRAASPCSATNLGSEAELAFNSPAVRLSRNKSAPNEGVRNTTLALWRYDSKMNTLRYNGYFDLNHLHFDYSVVRFRIALAERAKSILTLTELKWMRR